VANPFEHARASLDAEPFDPAEFRREGCDADDCGCYPHYGGAPGSTAFAFLAEPMEFRDRRTGETRVIPAGTPFFADGVEPAAREEWPPNFREDLDAPGLGTWFCPRCMRGMEGESDG
jgi:hypothetical protein